MGDPTTAVQWLEKADSLPRSEADIPCDLSAAYQLRAASRKDSADFARAIDSARRGIAQNPKSAVCAFNLALALRQVGLAAMADDAFSQAAALEVGEWANEARARVRSGTRSDGREDLIRRIEPVVSLGAVS
jgi:tetratricopeptide (TPR) repeat protein